MLIILNGISHGRASIIDSIIATLIICAIAIVVVWLLDKNDKPKKK